VLVEGGLKEKLNFDKKSIYLLKTTTMNLNPELNFDELKKWLDENLTKSFRPHVDVIPNSKSKGIYFWFMKHEGYKELSKYVEIKPISRCYSKDIDSMKYDLVYLGTTGTGKKGKSTLNKRLNWHINQKHLESTINQKQSALSTLRTGLGALLSEDLIESNTEAMVNQLMEDYFVIYFLEYPENKGLIDSDEDILIKGFKPLLNIKGNPNSLKKSIENSTKFYKLRRNEVENKTKKRLQGSSIKSNKVIFEKMSPNKKNNESRIEIIDNNIEKQFKNAQVIHKFFSKQKFDSGEWHFLIFETQNPSHIICENWTKTEIPNKYFGNTETNKNRMIDNKQVARWKIIEKEMADKSIESVTVKIFKLKK
jgi:hypothetical protein